MSVLATAAPAAAQAVQGGGPAPPLEGATPWMAILCSLAAAAAIGVAAFKNSRRTHLD